MIRLLSIQRLPNKEQRHTIVTLLQVSGLVSHLDRKRLFWFRGFRNNEPYITHCSLQPFGPSHLDWKVLQLCLSEVCNYLLPYFLMRLISRSCDSDRRDWGTKPTPDPGRLGTLTLSSSLRQWQEL